jgi:hypothetical protein
LCNLYSDEYARVLQSIDCHENNRPRREDIAE